MAEQSTQKDEKRITQTIRPDGGFPTSICDDAAHFMTTIKRVMNVILFSQFAITVATDTHDTTMTNV